MRRYAFTFAILLFKADLHRFEAVRTITCHSREKYFSTLCSIIQSFDTGQDSRGSLPRQTESVIGLCYFAKIMPTKVRVSCILHVYFIPYSWVFRGVRSFGQLTAEWINNCTRMYHFCRNFKRDKNTRLLVKTLKRKVLLFSYICSIKKSKQHRGFIYVTRYRSFFITFVLSRHYPLPSRFPARRFPVSKSRFFLSNFPASFCVHRIDAQSRCLFTFIALNIFA